MADFSAFSNNSFQTHQWINSALKEKSEGESLESYLAQLAMKLHIISQDYTDQLETAMTESVSIMPRLQSEILRIEESLKGIKSEMAALTIQLKLFDEKNVAGSEELQRLDSLKVNMEGCQSILLEHHRWSIIVSEAKNFMESGGKLSDSADRIEILHKSLEILKYLPGHEDRKETCDQLSENLISALQSRVTADIVGNDISVIQDYLYVYERLGRKGYLETEYATNRPKILTSALNQIHISYTQQNTSATTAAAVSTVITAASSSTTATMRGSDSTTADSSSAVATVSINESNSSTTDNNNTTTYNNNNNNNNNSIQWFTQVLQIISAFIHEELLNTQVLFGAEHSKKILCSMLQILFVSLFPHLNERLNHHISGNNISSINNSHSNNNATSDMIITAAVNSISTNSNDIKTASMNMVQIGLEMYQLLDAYMKEFSCLLYKDIHNTSSNNMTNTTANTTITPSSSATATNAALLVLSDREKLFETYSVVYKTFYDYIQSHAYIYQEISLLKAEIIAKHIQLLNQVATHSDANNDDVDFDFDNNASNNNTKKSGINNNTSIYNNDYSTNEDSLLSPDESLAQFNEKLTASITQIYSPLQLILHRSTFYFHGISLKMTVKQLSIVLNGYIQYLCGKVDDVRSGYGYNSYQYNNSNNNNNINSGITNNIQSTLATSAVKSTTTASTTTNASTTTAVLFPIDASTSKTTIATYQKQIEMYGLNDKDLITPTLSILLSVGKLITVIQKLDIYLTDRSKKLLESLINKDLKNMLSQLIYSSTTATTGMTINKHTQMHTSKVTASQIYVYSLLQNNFDQFSELKSFLSLFSSSSAISATSSLLLPTLPSSTATGINNTQSLTNTTAAMLNKFKTNCGGFLFELCSSAIEKLLINYSLDEPTNNSHHTHSHSSHTHTTHGSGGSGTHEGENILLQLDNFLPQSLITQVGEHLLSLFQEFESFPWNDYMTATAMVTMSPSSHSSSVTGRCGGVGGSGNSSGGAEIRALLGEAQSLTQSSQGWCKLKEILHLNKEDNTIDALCKRSTSLSIISSFEVSLFGSSISVSHSDLMHLQQQLNEKSANLAVRSISDNENANGETVTSTVSTVNNNDDNDNDNSNNISPSAAVGGESVDISALFINEWLGGIVDAILGFFLAGILQLGNAGLHHFNTSASSGPGGGRSRGGITPAGAAQLCVDVDYLSNVLNAMGLRQHPLLNHLRQLLERSITNTAIGDISNTAINTVSAIDTGRQCSTVTINTLQKIHTIITQLLENGKTNSNKK